MDDTKSLIFANEVAGHRGANPDLLALVRNAGQLCANAAVLRDSMYCMMAAKLHAELQGLIKYGDLTNEFRLRLTEMCRLYSIEVKPATLVRYMPAGRLMLKCIALGYVDISLLMNHYKVTEKMLEFEEMRMKLEENGPVDVLALLPAGDASILGTLNRLMHCLIASTAEDWAVTRVNASFSALDFANIMGVGQQGFSASAIVWEYAKLVNKSLKTAGVNGVCVTETFHPDLLPEKLDWIAVACCDVKVGVLLDRVEKKVTVYNYEHTDEETLGGLVKSLVEKVNFIKKFALDRVEINGYGDVSLLHWLSHIVGRKQQQQQQHCPIELVRLQVILECLRLEAIPPRHCSWLEVLKREWISVWVVAKS